MAAEMKPESKAPKEVAPATPPATPTTLDELDRLFDSFFRRSWMRPWRFDWQGFPEMLTPRAPKVDVVDHDAEIVVRAEVPGVDKKDIDISVGEDSVTIKGSTRQEQKETKGDYFRHELTTGSFSRTVGLPATVDGAKAKADYKDGVLELTLPKLEKARRHSVKLD